MLPLTFMTFSLSADPATLWLLGGSIVCVLLIATYYILRVRTVADYRRKSDAAELSPDTGLSPASVVVYSQGDGDNLAELLKALLSQDYPAAYEVIVVNEGESADVRDVVEMQRANHSNIYLTFTPEGVVNLSRKKLALTLGVKAARHPVVVMTTSAVVIDSDKWLRRMMEPFNNDKIEVALGYAYADPTEDNHLGKRHRAYDVAAESARWLGVALAGKPFRGTEYNLAYRKSTFIRNKGFAHSLNLKYGDDDIFVSSVANATNTAVVLSEDSMVRVRHGNHPRIFMENTVRRIFTERFIRRRPRLLPGLTGWLHLAAVALAIAAAVYAWPNLTIAAAAVIVVLALAATDMVIWRKLMSALKCRRLLLTLPWLTATHPLRRLSARLRSHFGHQKRYTWD